MDHAIACDGAASRSLGLLAQLLGRSEEAARHFEHALGLNAWLGACPLLTRTRYEYARMLLADGRADETERALALLEGALKAAREMGMAGLEEQAAALRATVAPTVPPVGARRTTANGAAAPARAVDGSRDAGRPGPPLTRREREVVGLIAQGFTNRQIAGELVVSNRTVEMHVSNVLAKLGITSRAQAAIWAYEHGLTVAQPH
jgi:DNA-binding CsgD family transcriptional regulator